MALTAEKAKDLMARKGLRQFLEVITIASRPEPMLFGKAADPWQWEKVLNPLIPAIESIAGMNKNKLVYDTFTYFMHKGADKTSVTARIATWGINYARRPTDFVVVARDRDQARSLRDAMKQERDLNPWLPPEDVYKINNYDAVGPTGTVEILSSDAKGGHGKRANCFILDEWAMWRDRDLSDMVFSSASKYEDCILIILSNCGYKGTFQHKIYEEMQKDPRCYIYHPRGIVASWIDKKKVERLRKKLVASEGRRLYDNEFVEASEESAWQEEDINAMFRPELAPWDTILPHLGDEVYA